MTPTPPPTMSAASSPVAYDRTADLRALDATFAGVSGLVASGLTHVPRIFRVPEGHHDKQDTTALAGRQQEPAGAIPVIDLGCGDRAAVVAAVRLAAAGCGFFQVTGHGVPEPAMAAATDAVRAFHGADGGEGTEKARLYSRDPVKPVKYQCNFDLYESPVANWRDTLHVRMAPDPPDVGDMPESCRDALLEYTQQVKKLGNTLFELLSEALGLKPSYLKDMECDQGQILLCHYYPPCPQPELAIGTSRHSDAGFLTILLQDEVGGLQIFNDNRWVDVTPTPGAFIVNVGDLLQLISNDGFRSVEHRVLAKNAAPRVSIAFFFSTHFHPASTRVYGPIKELLSDKNIPLYRETLVRDYMKHYFSIGLDAKTAISDFRL
ncbi:1-aminocyclopropane-1-carboxylate oxidase-1-like protein [Hordeum vulgare]|uniref:Fe2OG dioxygenase domain-containing protein n=1 Tax=Hordeum vulgare subsp. vulgare TaxID=112509 RepID=A0A8I6WPP1_HORVV|nr:1-aminocyclopropane-1-carboxylate oxidase homolog 1-like [Hordeum vulgare subsp. vulgare]KAE8790801.1 1-aminocyclopropane-1-carboxylate oxidase-1-like protein [Hordeum vulgare]